MPKNFIPKFLYQEVRLQRSEAFLVYTYNNLIVKFPITFIENNYDKKLLLAIHLKHISIHSDFKFKISYKFLDKNRNYILSKILEVSFPKFSNKMKKKDSYSSKNILNAMNSEIDISRHEATIH